MNAKVLDQKDEKIKDLEEKLAEKEAMIKQMQDKLDQLSEKFSLSKQENR